MKQWKFYLAARYSRRGEMRRVRDTIVSMGHVVTSRWIDTDWAPSDGSSSSAAPPSLREEFALKDMTDLYASDCVINFSESPGNGNRGGRHVEFGMAVARNKRIILVGEPEHIFHHLPMVTLVESTDVLYELLTIMYPLQ